MDWDKFKFGVCIVICVIFTFMFSALTWAWILNKDPNKTTGIFFGFGHETNLKDWETIYWLVGYLGITLGAIAYATYLYPDLNDEPLYKPIQRKISVIDEENELNEN